MKWILTILLLAISSWAQITNGSQPTYSNTTGTRWLQPPFIDVRNQPGATSDVQITNAIAALPSTGGKIQAFYTTAQTWAACPTWGSNPVHLELSAVTYTVAVGCSIPSNVTLEFTRGAMLSPANATTTTILGTIIAGRQQIFTNITAGLGTISFTASTRTTTLYPQWFGAKADGTTDDTAALQAASDVAGAATASTPGASIIDLGCGTYKLTSQWTIASSNGQHHVEVHGVNPLCTTINATVAASPATAIFLSKEKFVTALSGFTLHQAGTLHNGVGITMGGLTGAGTQTNGSTLENIIIDSFDTGLLTTDPGTASTSSEMVFTQMVLQNNNTGFVNSSQNGLDYVFIMVQMSNNTLGMNLADSGLTVLGGSGSTNGTDFQFLSGAAPPSVVKNYRSEVATTQCVSMAGDTNVSLEEFTCQGLTTPTAHTAITQGSAGLLEIKNSFIGGQIVETSRGSLSIKNSRIIDPNNTWSPTNQVVNMGPGFRINSTVICSTAGGGSLTTTCPHYSVTNTYVTDAAIAIQYQISSAIGWMSTGVSSGSALAVPTTPSIQGPTLAVSGNAITVTAYVHHVGAGLIKNISLLTNATYPLEGSVNWELNCVQLVADAAYTTDLTGNIAVAVTATVNQVITWCLDPLTVKWYPSADNFHLQGGTWQVPGTIGSTTPNTGAFTTVSATGQVTSTLATGTAPLVIASTTTVPNLTISNHPKVQACGTTSTCSATAMTSGQIVQGSAALVSGTPSAVTITAISPAFTSTATYNCTATEITNPANNLLSVTKVSGSSITITGPNTLTDVVGFICVGN